MQAEARRRSVTAQAEAVCRGMWIQAAGIALIALSSELAGFAIGSALLGAGTAMVYPTLLAAIGDVARPSWRASAVGVYRLWRDLGYAIGAVIAGLTADAFGIRAAIWLVAAVTFALRAALPDEHRVVLVEREAAFVYAPSLLCS